MADLDNIQFGVDLKKFARTIDLSVAKVVRKVSLDVFRGVLEKTPVDTGAARASWQIGVNRKSDAKVTVTGGKMSKGGASAIANKQTSKLSTVNAYDEVIISNNVPYAQKLEYGGYLPKNTDKLVGGFSKQAPRGMARITLIEIAQAMTKTLKDL